MTESASRHYAAIVIGAGAGGLTVAIGLAGLGKEVALVEAGAVGGDCTNVGCIPSKTLIHLARSGSLDPFAEVRKRRDKLRDRETREMQHIDHLDFVAGRATVAAKGRVCVDSPDGTTRLLTADHVVISTGSQPRTIRIDGLPASGLLTNENLWDLQEPPGHLAIVGGGPIGLEMAAAFARLGTSVSLIELAPRLLPAEDPEVSRILTASLGAMGVKVYTGHSTIRYDDAKQSLVIGPTDDPSSEVQLAKVDRVLLAVGRIPRSGGLGLEDLGAEIGRSGIAIDAWGRTSLDGLWAVGDVTGDTLTTHGANAMGRRLVQAIGLPAMPRLGSLGAVPMAVFTELEVASVGERLDAISTGWPADAVMRLQVDLADVDRGYTDGVEHGTVIVHVERLTGRILRATIVGPAAAEAIGLFTLAIDRGVSMYRLYRQVHPYPTYAGAIGKVADEFARQTLPNLPTESVTWLRTRPARVASKLRGRFGR